MEFVSCDKNVNKNKFYQTISVFLLSTIPGIMIAHCLTINDTFVFRFSSKDLANEELLTLPGCKRYDHRTLTK